MKTPRSEAGAIGIQVHGDGNLLGSLCTSILAGWDDGPGGLLTIAAEGSSHLLSMEGWVTNARQFRVLLPPDSLRDIGGAHDAQGARLRGEMSLTVGDVELLPALSWTRELLEAERKEVPGGFLYASPAGATTTVDGSLGFGAAPWELQIRGRRRDFDVTSPIHRAGASAGRIPLFRSGFTAWGAQIGRTYRGRFWSLEAVSERLYGELSARVETWPFAGVWGSVSTPAYRLDAELRGKAIVLRIRSDAVGHGWRLGGGVDRYEVVGDRESWYVGSLGFGRREEESRSGGVDETYVLRIDLARSRGVGIGEVDIRVSLAMPVYAERIGSYSGPSGSGLAGHAGIDVAWSW